MAELSFQVAETIIKTRPQQAEALFFEYQQYLKSHPEILAEDLSASLPQSVLDGKVISEAYFYLRDQHENEQMQTSRAVDPNQIPYGLGLTPLLAAAFFQRPKTMQDDKDYRKVENTLKENWLKKNNAKDFLSKEGLDYLYGSLDGQTGSLLRKEAEEEFRKNPKFKKRIERYDKEAKKLYKNYIDDPAWQVHEMLTQVEINDRLKLLRKTQGEKIKLSEDEVNMSQDAIIENVHMKSRVEFMRKNQEKARAYFERIETEKKKREEKKQPPSNISVSDVRRALEEEQASAVPRPSRLQNLSLNKPSPPAQTIESNVSNLERGGLRIVNQAGKTLGQTGRMAAQAGRVAGQTAARLGTLLVSNPYVLPVIIALVVVVVVVVVIVGTVGKDKYASQQDSAQETALDIATPSAVAPQTPSTLTPAL